MSSIMSSSTFYHQLTPLETSSVSSDWLSRELSRAQSSLDGINKALAQRRDYHRSTPEEDEDQIVDSNDNASSHSRRHDTSSPQDKLLTLKSLSNQLDCLSIAARYLDALQLSLLSSSSSDPNGSTDGRCHRDSSEQMLSMQQMVALESQLGFVLQSYSEDYTAASVSSEFQEIYCEIRNRHNKIQRHIRARAVLALRKVFHDLAYPSSDALEYLHSEIIKGKNNSEFYTSLRALEDMDVELLARELARPIVDRVQYHFLKSETIPRDKVLKVPHLLFAYLRQVMPHVAPIVTAVHCEVHFYGCIHDLIQHVMFQRGFFEKIGGANIMAVTNLIQDILKFDDYTLQNVRRECMVDMPTLVDKLVCANSKLLDGWIHVERTYAISALDRTCKEHGCDAIVSTAEVFYSLLHSHRCKISFVRQLQMCRIQYFQQVILAFCMHYLNILHKRATVLRSAMEKSTIYDLSINSTQWIMLIQCTQQAAQTLKEQDGVDDDNTCRNNNLQQQQQQHQQQQLCSLSESFEKFSVAMVEECAQRLVDLLMERSTFSSFLMTAGHLLSHGSSGGIVSDGMEDVCMILSVWNDGVADDSEKTSIKDRILEKVCCFIQQQLLDIVFDESLYMTDNGCKQFSETVAGILKVLHGRRQNCGRLDDVCAFMSQVEKFRDPLYVLLGKESHEMLDYLELEGDGTLYSEVENMLQVKGFSYINVEDAISLVNRIRKEFLKSKIADIFAMTDDILPKEKTTTEDQFSKTSPQNVNSNPSQHFGSWEKVLCILSNAKKKLRLRILDTVFLQSENNRSPISNWYFTSKNGELVKRGEVSSLTLHHVYDRFCRLALTGPNASGPRIIAIGYSDDNLQNNRITFTAEQLERDAKSQKASSLQFKCSVLQCFISPSLGNENFFQGVYSCTDKPSISPDDKCEERKEVVIYAIEDFLMLTECRNGPGGNDVTRTQMKINDSALNKWVQKEIEVAIMKIVHELERTTIRSSVIENKVSTLSANFVLDGQKKLWLLNTFNVISRLDERQSGFNVGELGQMDALPRLEDTRRKSILQNESNDKIIGKKSHGLQKKKKDEKFSDRKISGKGISCEIDVSLISSDTDELSRVEKTISQLKSEFAEKTQARDEHLSMINAIRSRISSEMEISTSQERVMIPQEQRLHEISLEPMKGKQDIVVPNTSPDSYEHVLSEMEEEIINTNHEPDIFIQTAPEIGEYHEIVATLQSELDDVSHRLKDELFEKRELRRKMDLTVFELSESLEKLKDKIQVLEVELSNEKIKGDKAIEQLKSSNRVLQAELVCQREYVENLKSSSLADLTSKLREGIEVVAAQEIAKSNIGTELSLVACEERWKRRLEEMQQEREKEKITLQEKHQNEMRYRQSQFQIQVEQSRIDIEDRLQQRFSESLKAAVAHKEAQRQLDIKHEIKRWEQMMSEMKARLYSEYQQQKDRAMKDRDQKWKLKMQQELKMMHQKLEDEKKSSQLTSEKNSQDYEERLQKCIEVAEQEKRDAVDKALKHAEEQWSEKMTQQERDIIQKVNAERDSLEIKAKHDFMIEFNRAIEIEKGKVLSMERVVLELKKEHEEEKQDLIDLVEKKNIEIEILSNEKKIAGELTSRNELQEEVDKINKYYTTKLEDLQQSNEIHISQMRDEWNGIIEAQIQATKLDSEKNMEETISKLEQDHEEQIHAMEYELSWLTSQKDKAEKNLDTLKNELKDKEQIIQSLQEEINFLKIRHGYNQMFIITRALQTQQSMLAKNEEISSVVEQLRQDHSEAEAKLSSKVQIQEARISKLEGKLKRISSTLLNHKRDALLEHKVKSREVALKISEISNKIELVESKRNQTNEILQDLIKAMQDIEKRLQDHSQISALQGDKVNTSHTRRKRRLDEEYEQILCKIEMKREDLYSVEEEAKQLNTEKVKANDEMRKLEKSLVELLVEQQKTLFSISTGNDM